MEENQKIKSVLFDLDGTLIDTAPDFILSLNNILTRYDYPELDKDIIRSNVSDGSRKLTALGFRMKESDPGFDELRIEFLAEYKKNLIKNACLFKGVNELINFLNTQKIKFGIVTNKPREYAEPLIAYFNELKESAVLVCSDDLAEPKPSPLGIESALRTLNIEKAECLYVGDHSVDMEAGIKAGLEVVACYYGYSLTKDNNTYKCYEINQPIELINIIKDRS